MRSAVAVAGSQPVVSTDSFGSKDPSYLECFFCDIFFAKESFLHVKSGGLSFKRYAQLLNHLLHVGIVSAVVWALRILREIGSITKFNAKVGADGGVGVAMAFAIALAAFFGLSFCAFPLSFAGFAFAVMVLGAVV